MVASTQMAFILFVLYNVCVEGFHPFSPAGIDPSIHPSVHSSVYPSIRLSIYQLNLVERLLPPTTPAGTRPQGGLLAASSLLPGVGAAVKLRGFRARKWSQRARSVVDFDKATGRFFVDFTDGVSFVLLPRPVQSLLLRDK